MIAFTYPDQAAPGFRDVTLKVSASVQLLHPQHPPTALKRLGVYSRAREMRPPRSRRVP